MGEKRRAAVALSPKKCFRDGNLVHFSEEVYRQFASRTERDVCGLWRFTFLRAVLKRLSVSTRPGKPCVICFNDSERANVSGCRMFYVLFVPYRERVLFGLGSAADDSKEANEIKSVQIRIAF